MGGGGSIAAMMASLRFNRGQRKKHRRSFKDITEKYPHKKGRAAKRKQLSPAELSALRQKLKADQKLLRKKKALVVSVLLVLAMIAAYFIYH